MNCPEYIYLIEDFNVTIICFCFIIFFSSSCPLTPLFVFVLAFISKNYDAYKIFNFYRVSILDKSDGIGKYNDFLKLFYYIGVLTNIAIVVFANPYISEIKLYIKFGIFLGFINLLLIVSYLINIDLHPAWFNNIYLFTNEFRKKYFDRRMLNKYHLNKLQ